MTLKCPICGKEYSYERKICQECEEYSNYSGLIQIKSFDEYKWNCAIFLGNDNSVFKSGRYCIPYSKLTPEPDNIKIGKINYYEWNCETTTKFNRQIGKEPIKSWLNLISKAVETDFDLIGRRSASYLVYE